MTDRGDDVQILDVRGMRKPDKHPAIFATYAALPAGRAMVLVNDHDPRHLREEFEQDFAGAFTWDYVSREPRDWQIRITKTSSTALPRVVADSTRIAAAGDDSQAAGAVWTLPARERDLDANIIALPPGDTIERHIGPDLDVLLHVLAGSGELTTEVHTIPLESGMIVWLPRRSQRRFVAGPAGLRYLTVHRRRQALVLGTSSAG
jgi:uncharacterized protein (DUF2249 family)